MSSYRHKRNSTGIIALTVTAMILAFVCIILLIIYKKSMNEDVSADSTENENNAGTYSEIEGGTDTDGTYSEDENDDGLLISFDEAVQKYGVPSIAKTVSEYQKDVNPEIFSVVLLPACEIEEPVAMSRTDEAYYSSHNETGAEDSDGCVYAQTFNETDYSDNLTVLYGRNTEDGRRFSNLHYYEDPVFMDSNPYIYIYTDSEVLIYQIYGAFTFKALHLIMVYDTNNTEGYERFIDEFTNLNMELNDNLSGKIKPTADDKMIVLSTGVSGDMDMRYLVSGVLVARAYLN